MFMPSLRAAMEEDYLQDDAVAVATGLLQRDTAIQKALAAPSFGEEGKYKESSSWLPKHVALLHALDLHVQTGLRILDLGCGPGWFSWLASRLGHTPVGLDLPQRSAYYKAVCDAMHVPVIEHAISPYTPLPDDGERYDVIVLLMAAFCLDPQWDTMEAWRFFLRDLESRLAPGGTVLFEMCAHYGLFYDADLYDLFTEFGYRSAGRFCVKTPRKHVYNALQRYVYGKNSFESLWYRAGHTGYAAVVWPNIDLLLRCYPKAVDLSVQLAISKILRGENDAAIALLENAVRRRPTRLGYALLLAQLLCFCGDSGKALAVVRAARRAMPRMALPVEWERMLLAGEDVPVATLSPYWARACRILSQSPVWHSMLEDREEMAAHTDPLSWYLRYGVPALPVARGFTPLLYLGIHYDVLLSGQDPLLHYIAYGESEQRKI